MGARRLINGTGSKRLTAARRVEDVGKQTRSGPIKTVRPGKSRSDSPEVSSGETEKISLSREAKKRATHETYLVLKAMRQDKRATYEMNVVLKAMTRNERATHVTFVVL